MNPPVNIVDDEDEPKTLQEYFERQRQRKHQRQENSQDHLIPISSPASKSNAAIVPSPPRGDQSSQPPLPEVQDRGAIWLFKDTKSQPDEWLAFRSSDQAKLAGVSLGDSVIVRGGRWAVDVEKHEMRPRFWEGDAIAVRRCLWCWKVGRTLVKPMGTEEDDTVLENKYLQLQSRWEVTDEEVTLSTSVTVMFSRGADGDVKFWLKKTAAWRVSVFKSVLFRGWEGAAEEDSASDEKPPSHLVLVVHGVGESLFARKDSAWPNFVECVSLLREEGWEQTAPAASGKTEFLPIEWWRPCNDLKSERIARASLPSARKIRTVSNEVVVDALMYITPRWREVILAETVSHMKRVVDMFIADHPGFSVDNITVVGHSLGSTILFDLLTTATPPKAHILPFVPRNFISMGSPVGFIFGTTEADPHWLNSRLAAMQIHPQG
jgi:hypothetical protein